MSETKQNAINSLQEIFGNHGFKNIRIELPEYDTSGGILANNIYVDVTGVKNGQTEQFNTIIKCSKVDLAICDDLNLRQGYVNEVNFYSKITPIITAFAREKNITPFENVPKCYGTIIRENEFIIVLENLKPKGFKMRDRKIPMNYDHIKLGFEAFARWHALCLAIRDQNPEKFELFELKHPIDVGNNFFKVSLSSFHNEFDYIIKSYKDKGKPHNIIEKLKSHKLKIEDLLKKSINDEDEDILVIKQGDTGNNNFLFRYDTDGSKPESIIIIDWQMSSFGSPVLDPSLFFFVNGSRNDLEKLDDLLKLYHDTFSKEMIKLGSDPEKCFSWKQFLESFNRHARFGIAVMLVVAKVRSTDFDPKDINLIEAAKQENFSGLETGAVTDTEEYFKALDSIIEFSIERNYM